MYGPGRLPSPSGQGRGKGARDPVRGDGDFRLCRGPARGPLGWAEALSPRVGRGCGFPLGVGFLLKVVEGRWSRPGYQYRTYVLIMSRG